MKRDALFEWIDTYLEIDRFGDYSPIGLQVEGCDEITKVALGVSAHLALIEQAAEWGAHAILVHHGFFWPGESQVLVGWRKKRIKALLMHDISLAGYHLPLDGHAVVGNNARIADELGIPADYRETFARAKGADIGLIGRFGAPKAASDVIDQLKKTFGAGSIVFEGGPEQIDTVGIVSGGGAGYYEEARKRGAQLFVTGEAREPTMAEAMETGTHFVAAGHYNTERLGIIALGDQIKATHGLDVRFFENANPV
jgi:dinuclear metal center YbgI/SA1388 family protein